MPRGTPWTVEQERKLRQLVKAGLSVETIAVESSQTIDSVRQKMRRLGLEVEGRKKIQCPSTTCAPPKELLTIEEALMSLAAAMKALEQPELSRTEILRLRSLVQVSKIYQEKFSEYVDYRRIEEELMELRKEVADLRKNAEENAQRKA